MSLKQQSTLITPRILAGQTLPLNISGRICKIVDAPASLILRVGDMPASLFKPGDGVEFELDSEFQRVEVTNPNNYDLDAQLWIGYARHISNRLALIEPETVFVPWVGTQIAAGTGQSFPPVISIGLIRRKALIVDNQDPSLPLHVRNTSGVVGMHVRAGQVHTLPISQEVEIFNPHGAAIACSVSEVYWSS